MAGPGLEHHCHGVLLFTSAERTHANAPNHEQVSFKLHGQSPILFPRHPLTHINTLAALQGKVFSVILTEGRPDETGRIMARALSELKVPIKAILDSAVAFALEAFQ